MRFMFCSLALAILTTGCFGPNRTQRRFFVLHTGPIGSALGAVIPGTVRVRNLDSESTYDKFQIVVRRNPYELTYRETDVWAVKPNRMVSDSLARRLQEYGLFSGVTRELGEQRPDYSLGGDLHAIELYDSGDRLYAHLSMTLTLASFRTGEVMWTYSYDQRREVPSLKFAHAIRVMSELLDEAATDAFQSMAKLGEPVEETIPLPDTQPATPTAPPPEVTGPIYLEERPATDVTSGAGD